MAKNIAARRAAKAQRRKAVVAQKRRTEMEANSIAGQVRLASAMPIQHCLLSEGLFTTGMGILVLARGATPHNLTMATFLLDTFALGVKDVFLRSLGRHEFTDYVESMSLATPMAPVEPAYARKLLHGLVAWSHSLKINPHPDYAKIEPLFGTTDAATCDAEFTFGQDGKPLLIGDLAAAMWDDLEFETDDTIEGDAVESPDTRLLEAPSEPAMHAEAD
jgi:hypothetical protein